MTSPLPTSLPVLSRTYDNRRSADRKAHDPHTLWERHREIIRLVVAGLSNKDIAETLSITPVCVSQIRNSTLGKQELARLSAERDKSLLSINERIAELLPKAIDTLGAILDRGDDKHKLSAAKDILDRGGFSAIKRTENMNTNTSLTKDDLLELRERGRAAGIIIDLEPNQEDTQDEQ